MITMIAAMSRNGVIGANGSMPWAGHLRTDMEHFVKYTTDKTVLMGRKTYDSIPARFKPFKRRRSVIVTRDRSYTQPDCEIVHNKLEIVKLSKECNELIVIGGAEIYQLMMPQAEKLVITHIHDYVPGDVFFPSMIGHWNANTIFHQERDGKNIHPFSIVEYTRV